MPTIQYSDGTKIEFSGTPTPQQAQEAYNQAKGIKTPAAPSTATEEPSNDRNLAQKAIGLFLDPIIETGANVGKAVGDLALTGINKVTGGALDKYTPEGNLDKALTRAENTPMTVPFTGTPIKPVNEITPKYIAGNAIETVALGLGSPAVAGAGFGAGGALKRDAGATETAIDTVVGAIGGKVLEYGFNAVAPYITKAALKYGQPIIDKVAQYVPETAKGFIDELSGQVAKLFPEQVAKKQGMLDTAVNTVNDIEKRATDKVNSFVKNTITGIREKIGGKTAAEILATPEADVAKLTAEQQKLWYQTQAATTRDSAVQAAQKAKEASDAAIVQAKDEINQFQQELGKTTRDTTIELKQPAQQLMKDMSARYVELTGEAADASPALKKVINPDEITAAIDSKFEYNPEVAASLKADLGIAEKAPAAAVDKGTGLPVINAGGESAGVTSEMTNQQILDKAREIMQTVSRSARGGGRVYTPAEYEAIQKYSFLMEQLAKNGVDMTEANALWRQWAPVRDRIVREIKPFDEGNVGKLPFSRTLQNAEATVKTGPQATAKLDAQNFIKEIETRMKLPKGSVTAKTKAAVSKVEQAKLAKTSTEKLAKDILAKIKADKTKALQEMSLKKYDTARKARISGIVKKTLVGLGIWAAAKATGLDKTIINAAMNVL